MLSALDALSYLIPTATFVVLGATIILNFTDEERVLARLNNMPKVTEIVTELKLKPRSLWIQCT